MPRSKNLTKVQKEFLLSMLRAIVEHEGPVSVKEIQWCHGKSDSRVRSHIKSLVNKGHIICVGKARSNKYVPTDDGIATVEGSIIDDPFFDDIEGYCVGGECQTYGCKNSAEDFFRGSYYCRKCIIGHDDESDRRDVRMQHEKTWTSRSPGGELLTMVNPTFGEDLLDTDDDI